MREVSRMLIVLAVICGLSGFLLSFLSQTTEPVIKSQILTYVQGPAIKDAFSQATNNPIEERVDFALNGGKTVTVFPYKQNDKLVGVAIEGQAGGYGGPINVMVGFDIHKESLLGIGIAEMKETPGLGSLITENKFTNQFVNRSLPVNLQGRGGTINAVSGATISSAGVIGAIEQASAMFAELKDEIQKQWQ